MSKLKKLAVEHDFYCSDSNYYSTKPDETYNTMTDFLDEYEETDIDMNLCFRWDVKETETDDGYFAEIFMMQQRKGIFKPFYIESIKEDECERFEKYAQKHWEKLNQIWNPISDVKEAKNEVQSTTKAES